jgi:hypothetical protein
VLDADIEACFDSISHPALMGRVRARVKDKRVLALVKAFCKAGILTELGQRKDTDAGTPQGAILSPLLANIALSVLDEHLHGPWRPGEAMSTPSRRARRRTKGLPNWRTVRYADDFVVLAHGTRNDVQALREDIARVLAPTQPADRVSGPILLNRRGARMDRHAATRRLGRLAEAAVVRMPRLHPHMLRHTFVTTMLDAVPTCVASFAKTSTRCSVVSAPRIPRRDDRYPREVTPVVDLHEQFYVVDGDDVW